MQTAIKTTTDQETQRDKGWREKKWLSWLIRIWDKEGKMPSPIALKRRWPDEYKQILEEFGTWAIVENRLTKVYEIHEKAAMKTRQCNWQQRGVNITNKSYSLEDFLLGTIKLQEFLGIERLPTYDEIRMHAVELSIPRASAYQRRLVNKKVWTHCMTRYTAVHPEERSQILQELEAELDARSISRDATTKAERRFTYSKADCLQGLIRVQKHLNLDSDKLPSKAQIDRCVKTIGTPCARTMQSILGYKGNWASMLFAYKEQIEIEEFLATYHELEVTKTVNLNSLIERIEQEATAEEKLRLENLTARMQKATRNQPVECQICLGGKEYEIIIRPKG